MKRAVLLAAAFVVLLASPASALTLARGIIHHNGPDGPGGDYLDVHTVLQERDCCWSDAGDLRGLIHWRPNEGDAPYVELRVDWVKVRWHKDGNTWTERFNDGPFGGADGLVAAWNASQCCETAWLEPCDYPGGTWDTRSRYELVWNGSNSGGYVTMDTPNVGAC